LEQLNKRLARVIEMRFFGEMTISETARALDISESTVKRDWMKARGWLYNKLKSRSQIK
jgi:RNA polymerase sigma factor (sigma-70 family)